MNRIQLLLCASVLVAGCSGATSPQPPAAVADLAMPATGGNGSPADMAMGGTTGTMLPFVVDTVFVTSGYMGDGSTAGTITMLPAKMGDSTDCNGMRASTSAAGSCHAVTYAPPASGGMGWGGVYWQYPPNNWGTKAGFTLPAGAKKVTFQAKGAKGGEKVTFLAGGIVNPMSMYTDSIKATTTLTLTAAWAPYSIDLTGQMYSQVLGGFGWTMTSMDAGASGGFFVDDIQWQ
jgi:hypothetical protein